MKIIQTPIPDDSMIRNYFPADYSDSFQCTFESDKDITPDDLLVAFWTKSPEWIGALFKIRNNLVKLVGLKGDKTDSQEIEDCIRNNIDTDLFKVVLKSENETIIRLSDKHLDAYLSAHIKNSGKEKTVSLITTVQMHNLLGHIYFYSICPFHKIVVKGMIKHTINQIR